MGKEEQREEREVLDSIFPDEITDSSENEYRITIALDVLGENEAQEELPTIVLRVSYPEDYPDVGPDLDLGSEPNAPKFKDLDVAEDKAGLLEALQPVIEENLGMQMIFSIVSALKDNAEALITERQNATQAVKDAEKAKAEEEENRKFVGTRVTHETFLEWRAKFNAEMAEEEKRRAEEKEAEDRKKRIPKEEKKLTGRQLWEKGMAGKGEDEEDVPVDVAGLKIEDAE